VSCRPATGPDMSLDRVDARFLLPSIPHSAKILGELNGWAEGLALAGVELSGDSPDLVVAPGHAVLEALSLDAAMLIVEGGRGVRPLRDAGLAVDRYLPRPRVSRPIVLMPLDDARATRYATAQWTAPRPQWRRLRNSAAGRIVTSRLFPNGDSVTAVALRKRGVPAFVGAAAERGYVATSWLLTPGRGDELSRSIFHLFEAQAASPTWVLKFARVPGYSEPFDRDETALAFAHAAGPSVSEHAPRILERFDLDGLEASLETAATGERLTRRLARLPRAQGLRDIDRIASWLVQVAAATAASADTLVDERRRLRTAVVPLWQELGVRPQLVDDLPDIGAVLQHNDVGPWNIVADNASFTLVDWESARRHGLPLWDLVYFVTEALAGIDRVEDRDRLEHAGRLFRGEASGSPVLFEWIRRAVRASAIPPEAVGPIVTLCWLHHGLSHRRRHGVLEALGVGAPEFVPAIERMPEVWLGDRDLGVSWSKWMS
jgi:hypothetical protein